MNTISELHVPGRNRLLELLPKGDRERLLSASERVSAAFGEPVFERNEPIEYVHFPLAAVISIVIVMEDGAIVEAGTVGNEGVAGLPLLFGAQRSPTRAFYQIPGEALRVPARVFTEEIAARGPLHDVAHRYAQSFVTQVAQTAACNRVHPVEQRLCRWILMSHDRIGSDRLLLTQEVMAQMLGVRRASVSVVAATLQKAGFIRYSRGVVSILDRAGLEASACECYAVVRGETERLLG